MKVAAICVVAFALTCVVLYSMMPDYQVKVYREHSFIINKEFSEVQRAMGKDGVLKKILEANDGEVLEEKWIKKNFHIERPLSKKHRYWHLDGIVMAKILIRDPSGEMVVDLKQTIHADQKYIRAEIELNRPISIGLTDMNQLVEFKAHGDGQTIVSMKLYMRLSRKVPFFMQDFADKRMHESADKQISHFEPIIRDHIANAKPGFKIPLIRPRR